NEVLLKFSTAMPQQAYAFVILHKNEDISLYRSEQRITGILSVYNLVNKAVSNFGKQTPPEDIGVHEFEFWCPQRRPEGHNLALQVESPLAAFSADHLKTGVFRPTTAPNAWVASLDDG